MACVHDSIRRSGLAASNCRPFPCGESVAFRHSSISFFSCADCARSEPGQAAVTKINREKETIPAVRCISFLQTLFRRYNGDRAVPALNGDPATGLSAPVPEHVSLL